MAFLFSLLKGDSMDINSLEPNSHKYRQETNKQKEASMPAPEQKEELSKVLTGSAKLKRRGLTKRFADIFFAGDIKDVKAYILMDVIVPAIKETIGDVWKKGIDMMLWGDTTPRKKKDGSNETYISYSSSFKSESRERLPSKRNRLMHRFDDIVLENRMDAEELLETLTDQINRYGEATVKDLYDALDITPTWADDCRQWGWTDIRGATITRSREGYVVELPPCTKL